MCSLDFFFEPLFRRSSKSPKSKRFSPICLFCGDSTAIKPEDNENPVFLVAKKVS